MKSKLLRFMHKYSNAIMIVSATILIGTIGYAAKLIVSLGI